MCKEVVPAVAAVVLDDAGFTLAARFKPEYHTLRDARVAEAKYKESGKILWPDDLGAGDDNLACCSKHPLIWWQKPLRVYQKPCRCLRAGTFAIEEPQLSSPR